MMSSKSARATVTAGLTTLTVLAALAAEGASGCGLISSDITSVKFDLPAADFTFDTAWVGTSFPGDHAAVDPVSGSRDGGGLLRRCHGRLLRR